MTNASPLHSISREQAILKPPPAPANDTHELIAQYWVEGGALDRVDPEAAGRYVVTPGVQNHLSALARAALLRRHPILLQVRPSKFLSTIPIVLLTFPIYLGIGVVGL
jgi:midasin